MPELPEIETLARTLAPALAGRTVERVRLVRPDVVRGDPVAAPRSRRPRPSVRPVELLQGGRVSEPVRHGKELALISDAGPVVCVHLGMSGQLRVIEPGRPVVPGDHVHCVWHLRHRGRPAGRLAFRDPRRFGGLWPFPSLAELRARRWADLGPDALAVDGPTLAAALGGTGRAVKAALLDQRLLAGVGNIYADEILFAARIHPLTPAASVRGERCRRLAEATRRVLRRAIDSGGSTIRDYVDGQGRAGGYAQRHAVYGRAGRSCPRCRRTLRGAIVAQRSTVYCPGCQRRRSTGER